MTFDKKGQEYQRYNTETAKEHNEQIKQIEIEKESYPGEAATKALKLYEGGFLENRNPGGVKSTVFFLSRVTDDETLQSSFNGILTLLAPEGRSPLYFEPPHDISK